jgi:arabinan endo-1,5-alpha-L-arabinosidase
MRSFSQTSYINPLTPGDFPDPSLIHVRDQGYYAYSTHDEFSPTINNILVKHSWDLVHWGETSGALLSPPNWAMTCRKFWCPQVAEVDGEFRLYYAAEPDTKDGMCLALAVSDRPVAFTDCGHPLSQLQGSTYQMIDPCFFIDPVSRKHLLYYGSAHEPIRVVELAPNGRNFITEPVAVLYPGEGTFHKLREGAFITYKPEWKRYFLWVSGDNTWAENSYGVSVYWSESPLALFEKVPGDHLMLRPNARWDSPGNNSIIEDAEGNEWTIYHAVDSRDRYIDGTNRFLRKMCMDRVFYTSDGWPYIKGSSPSVDIQKGPSILEQV